MVANIPYNPLPTSNALGSFNISSVGGVQGTFYDDPAVRYQLAGGYLAEAETIPMWGGVGVYENIAGSAGGPQDELGSQVGRATALTGSTALAGFSVFNQAEAMVQTPESPVPLAPSYGQVNFFRLGSNARIKVACDPNLVDLQGNPTTTDVSWDFENQMLVPYTTATINAGTLVTAATVSSGTYNPVTGLVTLTMNTNHGLIPGDSFALSAMAGTGSFALLNGTWTAAAGTATDILTFYAPTGNTLTISGGDIGTGAITYTTTGAHHLLPGDTFEVASLVSTGTFTPNGEFTAAAGTSGTTIRILISSALTFSYTSGGTLTTGGILPVRVLDVLVGNSMTVDYNSNTGFATWNRNGTIAIILI